MVILKGTSDIKKYSRLRFLILSYTGLSILIMILATVFINKWNDTNSSFDNLSPAYYDFTIGYDRDMLDEENYNLTDFLDFISLRLDKFRLQKTTDNGYSWIFTSNHSLNLELIEGREFNKSDFESNNNVAIISKDLSSYTYLQDDKKWIDMGKDSYEVIGVFNLKENTIYKNSKAFLNITSDNYIMSGNLIEGRYYLDVPFEETNILGEIDEWCGIVENDNIFSKTYKERYNLTKDAIIIPVNIVLMGLLFIVLSIIYITSLWLISIRKEVYIRRLCGASRKNIIRWILANYINSILIAFLFGYIIPFFLSVKKEVLLFSFVFIVLVGLVNCSIIILKFNKMKIISLKK